MFRFNLNSQADRNGNIPTSRLLIRHKGCVSSCLYVPDQENRLITISGDQTCGLWDVTTGQRISVFGGEFSSGHIADVLRLFDMRTGHQLQVHSKHHGNNDSDAPIVTSIAFSISGRLLFAGYSNGDCYVWDTLVAEVVLKLGSLQNSHEDRISCLGLSADGSALCTGIWDKNLKVKVVVRESTLMHHVLTIVVEEELVFLTDRLQSTGVRARHMQHAEANHLRQKLDQYQDPIG